MKKYFFVGVGGIFGAISRYLIREIQLPFYHGQIPLNTLIINVTGSLFLAFLLTLVLLGIKMDENLRLGITTGFIGAFTTFSTLCKEMVSLFMQGAYVVAIGYVLVSAALGMGAALFGCFLAGILRRKCIEKLKSKDEIAKPESDVTR